MKTISIVIPVYFNEKSLPLLYQALIEVEATLLQRNMCLELIFVDDGSQDQSFKELMLIKEKRPDTIIVKLSRNFGAVHASKAGLQYVSGDCFMLLAADLQDSPDTILNLIDEWLKGNLFILARRNQRRDPFFTKLFAAGYYFILKHTVVKTYPQGGFDLFLMDKLFLPYMQQSSKNVNPNLYAYSLGLNPAIISYQRNKRVHGKSRWTLKKKIVFFLDSILGFSMVPLRFVSSLGFIAAFSSFIYGIWIFIHAFLHKLPVPGFATIMTTMTFLLGLIIIILGIIGEYLWRIFDEVNNRPEYVVEKVY